MKRLLFSVLALAAALPLSAKVTLPSILGSNMVLQRNTSVNVWGTASAGKQVKITSSWNGKTYTVTADNRGKWDTRISTGEAGGPYTLSFDDGEKLVLDNILLGEVWICSGQSNMEMPVRGFVKQPVEGGVAAIADAMQYPMIRMFTVPKVSSETPKEDCEAAWQTSSPASVGAFSAVGYFFGRTLNKVLNIPIGLVASHWGGSSIETWMTEKSIDEIPDIDHRLAKSSKAIHQIPQRLYNGMILPICPFTARGFIWYQGEANRHNASDYKQLQISLIRQWRKLWGDDQMPFYITQLAPFRYNGEHLHSLPLVIEAQYQAAAELEHVAVAATTDLKSPGCIHPRKKEAVGQRLAFLALQNDYDIEGLPAPAPTYRSMVREGDKLILSFNHINQYNHPSPYDTFATFGSEGVVTPQGFEIAGEDRVFHPAKSLYKHNENQIVVWAEEVPHPVAVRYAFRNYCPEANVTTTLEQPLPPFRTDNWEITE